VNLFAAEGGWPGVGQLQVGDAAREHRTMRIMLNGVALHQCFRYMVLRDDENYSHGYNTMLRCVVASLLRPAGPPNGS
jgi:hypothetical protein